MRLVCLDLEGVLVPEIWQGVAADTGVAELNLTTRDIPDYHKLMRKRLTILRREGVTLPRVQAVAEALRPLEGAKEFLDELRARVQVAILSDTYAEFASPLMQRLGWPLLLCNTLSVDGAGLITDYHLRQEEGKLHAVRAFRTLNLEVYAAGDSYNDLSMILAADEGAFFRPPESIVAEHPDVPVCRTYQELLTFLTS